MLFLTKDKNLDAYILTCPVLNEEARCKLLHMDMDVPAQRTCDHQTECCPNTQQGRICRVPRTMRSQIDWDHPQFSYRFKLEYAVRTKIERLIGRMKCHLKMSQLYKRSVFNIGVACAQMYEFACCTSWLKSQVLTAFSRSEHPAGRRGSSVREGLCSKIGQSQQKARFSLTEAQTSGKMGCRSLNQEGNGRRLTLIYAVAQLLKGNFR